MKEKKSFWHRQVSLDVPSSTLDSGLAFEENPFKKALDRYWEEKEMVATQRKMLEELKDLRQAVQRIDEREIVRGILRDIRSRFSTAYQQVALHFSSHH